MAPRKRVAAADDSSSEDEIDMDRMIETKDELNKIRRDREAKRTQLQKDLDKKLADLNQRIKQTVDAHIQQLTEISVQQLERLVQAVASRDEIDQMIEEKLVEVQREGRNLAAVLDSGYEYRLEKAKSLVTPVLAQEPTQDEGRPMKKVKIGISSS